MEHVEMFCGATQASNRAALGAKCKAIPQFDGCNVSTISNSSTALNSSNVEPEELMSPDNLLSLLLNVTKLHLLVSKYNTLFIVHRVYMF